MLSKTRMEEILKETDALLEGHFIYTSGRHGAQYMQCAQILQYPCYAEEICHSLAEAFAEDHVDAVVGPAVGGILIAYEMARSLNALSLFSERENGTMTFRRGFDACIQKGTKILIAENVITTGGTVREVMELISGMGADVVGVAVLVDRSMGKIDFGVKTRAAYTADLQSWDADDCPLCKKGKIPPVKPGSRRLNG